MKIRTQHTPVGSRRRVTLGLAVLAVLAAVPVYSMATGRGAQAANAAPGDGTTSATAGASCWGIKQAFPASANGTYWLNNAALVRPQQFSCDMTTNGGGWVLVGRGREGWTFNPFGQGSATTVRTTIDGTGAFAPAALDTTTINALLNGTAVNTLPDGIRLERATNSSGTTRQSYNLFPKAAAWNWSFGAPNLLDKVVIDGSTYLGSNTYDTSVAVSGQTTNQLAGLQGDRRLFTWQWASHNNKAGFSFGSGMSGASNSSSNYLWNYTTENHPIPFTRVWLRPQIANSAAGFSPLPAGGYPAEAKPATLKNKSELAPWGVVGLDHTNETAIEPYNTNVLSLQTAPDRTFVGGRFSGVQNGPSAAPIAQKYLAAFDLDGNWISTFRPTVNGRVWDMVLTADNKLIIAGDFTNVNGVANTSGMAALNPSTGDVITSWKGNVANTTSRLLVRTLDLRGNTIYAAGSFNRYTGGTWNTITVTSAVSMSAATGSPGTWRPRPSGQVVDAKVTQDGTRVLMGGYFNKVNSDANHGYFAITDAATGNPVAGIGPWTDSIGSGVKLYQQAVNDLGDGRIFVGGSEHNIQLWDWNRTTLVDAAVTKAGGDTQVMEIFGDRAYIGCHCGNWVYEGTNNYGAPSGFRSARPINLVGAWNTATWNYDTSWYPSSLKGARGEGVWAVDKDSRGCVWVGGDLDTGGYSGNPTADWLGGFARFCQEDVTPPTAPTGLASTPAGTGVTVSWLAATDNSGSVSYDVYRDDRVIATVYGLSYTDPEVTGSHRYTVRAVDSRGNRSASPAPVAVNGPSPVIAQVLNFGDTWKYQDTGANPGTAWRASSFDDSAWPSGPGKLGWGRPEVVTTIGATKPIATYFRRTFQVADASQVKTLDLKLSVTTGAVVYVNGVEAGRINMPQGTVTSSSPAAAYVSGTAETSLKTVTIPASLLVNGTNTIAVEVHNMTVSGSRLYLDLQGTTFGSNGDTTAPSAPSLSGSATAAGVTLNWTASIDDVALGGYEISRDGQRLAVAAGNATSYLDGEVDLAVAHSYVVTAFDMNGNAVASNAATAGPLANPNLLAYGATWRWSYTEAGQAAGWQNEGFDDSAWATGPAELGYGDADEKTIISTAPTPRPATAYFRTTVNVANPAAFSTVLANLIRDDGAVVWVNGVEVGRDNMPAGTVTGATLSSTVISNRTAEMTPVAITIPSSAFHAGVNTIAVEIHNSDRWSGDLSFDLKLTGQL